MLLSHGTPGYLLRKALCARCIVKRTAHPCGKAALHGCGIGLEPICQYLYSKNFMLLNSASLNLLISKI